MMCLNVNSKDIEEQRVFANAVTATARLSGVHIHLVAHPRKLVSAEQELDINDVAGSADLGRLADNVVFVRRAANENNVAGNGKPIKVSIRKQRHGTGATGDIGGWFHRHYRQFSTEQFMQRPIQYLPAQAYGVDFR
jgi:twinkle protein